MDAFVIVAGHVEPVDGILVEQAEQLNRCIANDILDEFGVVVGTLGDTFLIGAFENRVELTGGTLLCDIDQIFEPYDLVRTRAYGDANLGALVVGPVLTDLLAARAAAGDVGMQRCTTHPSLRQP